MKQQASWPGVYTKDLFTHTRTALITGQLHSTFLHGKAEDLPVDGIQGSGFKGLFNPATLVCLAPAMDCLGADLLEATWRVL